MKNYRTIHDFPREEEDVVETYSLNLPSRDTEIIIIGVLAVAVCTLIFTTTMALINRPIIKKRRKQH